MELRVKFVSGVGYFAQVGKTNVTEPEVLNDLELMEFKTIVYNGAFNLVSEGYLDRPYDTHAEAARICRRFEESLPKVSYTYLDKFEDGEK